MDYILFGLLIKNVRFGHIKYDGHRHIRLYLCFWFSQQRDIYASFGNLYNISITQWFHHIAQQPVYCESQAELDQVCKENESYIVQDDPRKRRRYWEKRNKMGKKHAADVARKRRKVYVGTR